MRPDKVFWPMIVLVGFLLLFLGFTQNWFDNIFGGTSTTVETDLIWNTKGDLAVGLTNNEANRFAVGEDGQILTASSTAPLGVEWTNTPDDITLETGGFSQSSPAENIWYIAYSITVPAGTWRLEYFTPFSFQRGSGSTLNAQLAMGTTTSTPISALTSDFYFSGSSLTSFDTTVSRSVIIEPTIETTYQMFVRMTGVPTGTCLGVGYNCAEGTTYTTVIRAVAVR